MTSRILRVSKRVAIILLIAVFSIAGIVACGGGQDITGSRSTDTVVDEPTTPDNPTTPDQPTTPDEPAQPEGPAENNWDSSTTWNIAETKGKVFYASSYRSVVAPLIGSDDWVKWLGVSYNDTDRLTRIWKAMIDRGIRDGKRRMYIKTHDGDLFFDADYNVRWSKQPSVILKRFQGGAMVRLAEGYGNNEQSAAEERRGNVRFSGSYAIGGLYTFADSLYNVNNKYHSKTINWFFNWEYNPTGRGYSTAPENLQWSTLHCGGVMELLVLHRGYPVDLGTGKYFVGRGVSVTDGWTGTAYAVQTYKEKANLGYRDGNNHLYNIKGNTPERYMPAMGVHQLYHKGFRWATDKTYDPDWRNNPYNIFN